MIDGAKLDSSPLLEFNLHCAADWRSAHHNVLLEGSEASTEALLRLLAPHLPAPVIRKPRGAPFDVPTGDVGALILDDVGGLSREEQARLLTWIDARPRAQIVSTTAQSLFALVDSGCFDVALYYRLNVILLDVDRRRDSGFHALVTEGDRRQSAAV